MSFMETFNEESKKEILTFLFLCGKKDGNILISEVKESEIPQFARLACIATVFGFRKVLFKIFAQTEKYYDQFKNELEAANHDFDKVNRWITDFVENVKHTEARQVLSKFWEEKKAKTDVANFDLRQLLE